MYTQILVEFCPLFKQILCGNKILTSINVHSFVANEQKMTGNNHNLYHVNINAYMKFGEILSICSQDIERKRNSDIDQEP